VLPFTADTLRLYLHVLAATIWVGGQLTLAGLVPGLRAIHPDAPATVARRFNRIAWPAYGVLVLTGVWNLLEIDLGDTSSRYQATLAVKLAVVAASGTSAFAHARATTRRGLAVGGAVAGVSALLALLFGVQLRGS
jgi:putative copper export protein